jgi:hypothetical protein
VGVCDLDLAEALHFRLLREDFSDKHVEA